MKNLVDLASFFLERFPQIQHLVILGGNNDYQIQVRSFEEMNDELAEQVADHLIGNWKKLEWPNVIKNIYIVLPVEIYGGLGSRGQNTGRNELRKRFNVVKLASGTHLVPIAVRLQSPFREVDNLSLPISYLPNFWAQVGRTIYKYDRTRHPLVDDENACVSIYRRARRLFSRPQNSRATE
jgi:hypothetical protein